MLSVAALSAGCRLPGREGPVSQSLATCREYSQKGIAAAERGRHTSAEALLAKAVEACAVDPEARRHYAEALFCRGAREEAIAQLEEASRLASEDATLQVRLAEMHLAGGNVRAAGQNAEYALDLNPKLAAAWAIRGRVMHANGQVQQALADYHRALGYAPDDREVLLAVAELYRQRDEPQRAIVVLHRLSDTYPPGDEPQQVLYLTGLAQLAMGRPDRAVESLSRAGLREKPTPEVLYRLGEAELLAASQGKSSAAAQRAVAQRPRPPQRR